MQDNGERSRSMLDERTAGLPSVEFIDADTESLGSDVTFDERDRDPNVVVPSDLFLLQACVRFNGAVS